MNIWAISQENSFCDTNCVWEETSQHLTPKLRSGHIYEIPEKPKEKAQFASKISVQLC